jgi:tetratricopeptide (TPR) repeat protein
MLKHILLLAYLVLITKCTFAQNTINTMQQGKELFLVGNYTNALPLFKQAIKTGYTNANFMTALCYYNLAKYTDATIYFNNEIALDSNNAQAYYFNAKIEEKNILTSLYYIDKALQLQPSNPNYIGTKAQLYYKHQQYYNSITWYEKLLKVNSRIDDAYYYLGYSYYYLNKHAKACNNWEKIVELDDFDNQEYIINYCKTSLK